MKAAAETAVPRVNGAREAIELAGGVMDTMRLLARVLDEETGLLRAGKISAALALEQRKGELAGAYMRGLEAIKANALAIARHAPDTMTELKDAHEAFSQTIALNHAVLATAHAVSEGIVRGLASEAASAPRAAGYGPGPAPRATGPAVQAIAVSRKL